MDTNHSADSEFPQETNFLQTFYGKSLNFYMGMVKEIPTDSIELNELLVNYIKEIKQAFPALQKFIQVERTLLVTNHLEELQKLRAEFHLVLIQQIRKVLKNMLIRDRKDYPECYDISFISKVKDKLRQWDEHPKAGLRMIDFSVEVASLKADVIRFYDTLDAFCRELENRTPAQELQLWEKRTEELIRRNYLDQSLKERVERYSQEQRTSGFYQEIRYEVLEYAPACFQRDLRFNYKDPVKLIRLARSKKLTEKELNSCMCKVWELNELDRMENHCQDANKDELHRKAESLDVIGRRDLFFSLLFSDLEQVKLEDGQLLIRQKSDWAFVGRYLKEREDLNLISKYTDFQKLLVKNQVNFLPGDAGLLTKTLQCVSEKQVYPHWKCDAHALLIGQYTQAIIEKYKFLLY